MLLEAGAGREISCVLWYGSASWDSLRQFRRNVQLLQSGVVRRSRALSEGRNAPRLRRAAEIVRDWS